MLIHDSNLGAESDLGLCELPAVLNLPPIAWKYRDKTGTNVEWSLAGLIPRSEFYVALPCRVDP